MLIIWVMIDNSSLRHFLSNHVGMESRLHEVDGDFIIISLTQSSKTGKNDENDELHDSVIDTERLVFEELFRTDLMLLIFLAKKAEKRSASTLPESSLGNTLDILGVHNLLTF